MGNITKKTFSWYNSSKVNYWNFNLDGQEDNRFNLYQAALSMIGELNYDANKYNSWKCIKKLFKKHGIDGIKFHGIYMDEESSLNGENMDFLTYVELVTFDDAELNLLDYLPNNLKELNLSNMVLIPEDKGPIFTDTFWKELEKRPLTNLKVGYWNPLSVIDKKSMAKIFKKVTYLDIDDKIIMKFFPHKKLFDLITQKIDKKYTHIHVNETICQKNITNRKLNYFIKSTEDFENFDININTDIDYKNIIKFIKKKDYIYLLSIYSWPYDIDHKILNCAENIHIWNLSDGILDALKSVINTSQNIKKISSGYDAMTLSELNEIKKLVDDSGKNIELELHKIDKNRDAMKDMERDIKENMKKNIGEYVEKNI